MAKIKSYSIHLRKNTGRPTPRDWRILSKKLIHKTTNNTTIIYSILFALNVFQTDSLMQIAEHVPVFCAKLAPSPSTLTSDNDTTKMKASTSSVMSVVSLTEEIAMIGCLVLTTEMEVLGMSFSIAPRRVPGAGVMVCLESLTERHSGRMTLLA